ncbi:hypothetical protein Mal4_06510 [Maioricimonas rarisocia]|uniref:Uncharacterized protein n=1 Tax=Maioricimonas rarisocia TaxID=2528026 RepID=A0A517Z1K1_9PLAN|nr:hypothetical protein [Maioricimonas rarisocia]QDU36366.1 hypothetical protein Mal4_06510 [Maioricimonas rarisocia]
MNWLTMRAGMWRLGLCCGLLVGAGCSDGEAEQVQIEEERREAQAAIDEIMADPSIPEPRRQAMVERIRMEIDEPGEEE